MFRAFLIALAVVTVVPEVVEARETRIRIFGVGVGSSPDDGKFDALLSLFDEIDNYLLQLPGYDLVEVVDQIK
ncbi:MAG: hypothetical protein CMJ78_10455 [Planctomycetaceae bacterium]|nr:hypothetical protein [Planctomycetaceae bacterium]